MNPKRALMSLVGLVVGLCATVLPARAQYTYMIQDPLRLPGSGSATYDYTALPGVLNEGIDEDFWEPYAYPPSYSGPLGYLQISPDGVEAGGFLVYLGYPNVKWALTGNFRVSFYLATGPNPGRMAVTLHEGLPGPPYCTAYTDSGYQAYASVWSSNESSSPPPDGFYYNMNAGQAAFFLFVKEGPSLSLYRGETGVPTGGSPVYQAVVNADGYFFLYFGTGSPNYAGTMLLRDFVIESEGLTPCDGTSPVPEKWIVSGDDDGDGVVNDADQCPGTAAGATVDASGCSIAQIAPCDGNWKNHGDYVSAVVSAAQLFKAQGLIDDASYAAIVSAAARSNCGKQSR